LKDKSFLQLGSWQDVSAAQEPVLRELLSNPLEEPAAAAENKM
jgi:hypothetical protein